IGDWAGDADFQHGDQLHVAKIVVDRWDMRPEGTRAGGQVSKGFAVDVLHLTGAIFVRPIQYIKGIPEMVRIGGAHLKIDKGRTVGAQLVDRQLKSIVS